MKDTINWEKLAEPTEETLLAKKLEEFTAHIAQAEEETDKVLAKFVAEEIFRNKDNANRVVNMQMASMIGQAMGYVKTSITLGALMCDTSEDKKKVADSILNVLVRNLKARIEDFNELVDKGEF